MDAVIERKKQGFLFDHKLTDEEIEDLIENYDYDPKYLDPDYDDEDGESEPIYDRFGNPTESTIRALYESRHGIYSEPMTLDEFNGLLDEWRKEADDEEAGIQNVV